MKNAWNVFISAVAGTNPEILSTCDETNQKEYRNQVYALFVSLLFAFIGGFDICHQFTKVVSACISMRLPRLVGQF